MSTKIPQCITCGRKLKTYPFSGSPSADKITTYDGLAPTRGGQGDNLVCTMACGYKLAFMLIAQIDGILGLLHPDTDRRNFPPPADTEEEAETAQRLRRQRLRRWTGQHNPDIIARFTKPGD